MAKNCRENFFAAHCMLVRYWKSICNSQYTLNSIQSGSFLSIIAGLLVTVVQNVDNAYTNTGTGTVLV